MNKTNELRLFISSTFRDLQEEREHLIKKIFPEIRAICRAKGVTFTEVDLRWGLTDQDQVLGHILGACMGEIDRCRPYFIGITGDRYGYIPAYHEIQKDPELLVRYPWIEDAVMEGASILDMEFRHAVLNTLQDGEDVESMQALFFFRRIRKGHDNGVDSEEREKLEDLKRRVRDSGAIVEQFHGAVTLGELIYDELLDIIQRDFADAKPPTPLEEERSRHESFAVSRRRAYIANVAHLKRLNEFARSDAEHSGPSSSRSLVVHADSGSGKSALLAYWAAQYRRKYPDAFLVEHYAGIGAGFTDRLEVIRHIMMEINERYQLGKTLPNTQESIEQEFPSWLAEVQKEPMLILIDGINHFSGRELHLGWLPKHIPSNVKLIVSTTGEQTLDALRERGWEEMEVQPLNEAEREAVIVRFLSEYHKALPTDLVKRISADPKCALPLFLRTLLEELRLFGQHEKVAMEIERYLSVAGPDDLFQSVLERLEDDFSTKAVREIMTAIWVSQEGLDEMELVELTGIPRLKLGSIIMALDFHLLHSNGRYTFFHNYLQRAVENRYLSTDELKQQRHLDLAAYFERVLATAAPASITPSSSVSRDAHLLVELERAAHELPWHYSAAGEQEKLRSTLSRFEVFTQYAARNEYYEFLAYWREIGGVAEMEQCYEPQLNAREGMSGEEEEKLLNRMCELYRLAGIARSSVELARRAVALSEARLGKDHLDVAISLNHLGTILLETGNYTETEAVLRRALSIREAHLGSDHHQVTESLNNLATVLKDTGSYTEAERLHRHALELRESTLGTNNSAVAFSLSNLAGVLRQIGKYAEAERYYRHALSIRELVLGYNHPLVADSLHNLMGILNEEGKYSEAEHLQRRAFSIWKEAYGSLHPNVANSLNTLAIVLRETGKYEEAEELQRQVTEMFTALMGENHPFVGSSLNNHGFILWQTGNYAEAERLFRRTLEIWEQSLGTEHPWVAQCLDNLANVLRDSGNMSEAEECYTRAMKIAEAKLGEQHLITARLLHDTGRWYLLKEVLPEARDYLLHALTVFRKLFGNQHPRIAVALMTLGDLEFAEGNTAEGCTYYRAALTIRQTMLGDEHPETIKSKERVSACP